jgi:deoxycytidine triphosphate deaminase
MGGGDKLSAKLEHTTAGSSIFIEDFLKPAYNGLVAEPANALESAANPVWQKLTGGNLPRVELSREAAAEQLSPQWTLQKTTEGLASLVPYLIASKVSGGLLKEAGAALKLKGAAAKLVLSDRFALVSGAAGYDFLRNDDPNGTSFRERMANACGGATAFYAFGVGNALTAESSLATKIWGRALTGAAGGSLQTTVSDYVAGNKLPTANELYSSALSGAVLNSLLPGAHEGMLKITDRLNLSYGRGISVSRYIKTEKLSGLTDGLSEAIDQVPFARIQPGNSSLSERPIGSNTILFDSSRQEALSSRKSFREGKSLPQRELDAQTAVADHLRTQLLNLRLAEGRSSGSILTNDQMLGALDEGRLGIEPRPAKDSLAIGENGFDVRLGERFLKLPKGQHIDLTDDTVAKATLRKWSAAGLEMSYPNGITLAPGEQVLGFTSEVIKLPRLPQRNVDGTMQTWSGPPLMAEINAPSSLARIFLPNHETAPALNNDNTSHSVVLEIRNDSDNIITLHPGQRIGSIVFKELGAFPSATERYKTGTVRGQTSVAGGVGPIDQALSAGSKSGQFGPEPETRTNFGKQSLGKTIIQSLSIFDRHEHFNSLPVKTEIQPPVAVPILDFESLSSAERLRLDPSRQYEYADSLMARKNSDEP